jgi:hypothetical protein
MRALNSERPEAVNVYSRVFQMWTQLTLTTFVVTVVMS